VLGGQFDDLERDVDASGVDVSVTDAGGLGAWLGLALVGAWLRRARSRRA
jgi:MYXO-CTERM domain-containing protein